MLMPNITDQLVTHYIACGVYSDLDKGWGINGAFCVCFYGYLKRCSSEQDGEACDQCWDGDSCSGDRGHNIYLVSVFLTLWK
jgi:hypothetical protein